MSDIISEDELKELEDDAEDELDDGRRAIPHADIASEIDADELGDTHSTLVGDTHVSGSKHVCNNSL